MVSRSLYSPPPRSGERFQVGHDLLLGRGAVTGTDVNPDDWDGSPTVQPPLTIFQTQTPSSEDVMGSVGRRPVRIKGVSVDLPGNRSHCDNCFAPSSCNHCDGGGQEDTITED